MSEAEYQRDRLREEMRAAMALGDVGAIRARLRTALAGSMSNREYRLCRYCGASTPGHLPECGAHQPVSDKDRECSKVYCDLPRGHSGEHERRDVSVSDKDQT